MAIVLSRTFTLGRYTCVERIGVTPVGEQWRAKRFGLIGVERQYLLTKLHPQLAKDPVVVARLTAAWKTYAELDHEGLLRFFEQGSQGDDYFAAFEFVGYADLRKLKAGLDLLGSSERASLLLPAIVVLLAQELLAALGRSHERGLFHGLISPQSVWLDAQGGVHLAEVGVGPALPAASWATEPSLKAVYPYMAPELQITGTPTAQSDVYSLGTVLQGLLGGLATGTPSAESAPILGKLLPVLQQATARVPAQRFASIAAMAEALQPVPLPMADAARSALQQVGEQFQLAGDTVPQPVVISERSSAEPLPPPPTGRVVLGKVNLSGPIRGRAQSPGARSPAEDPLNLAARGPGAEGEPGGVVQGDEDTPLPMSRPLLVTNPKISLRGSEGDPRSPATPPGTASVAGRPRSRSSENQQQSAAARARSGLDWLASQSGSEQPAAKPTTKPELPALVDRPAPASQSLGESTTGPQPGGTATGRRPAGPVSINAKAQFGLTAPKIPSANTPTAELDDEIAAANSAAGTELKWTPEVVASTPEKNVGTGTYAHLVQAPVELSSVDALSVGETNPALAPIRVPGATRHNPLGDEPTNQISASEALAIAEADRVAVVESGQTVSSLLPRHATGEVARPNGGSEQASSPGFAPGQDYAAGAEQPPGAPELGPPQSSVKITLLVALGLLGLLGGGGVTYLATRHSTGTGQLAAVADGGAAPADGHGAELATRPKSGAAGEVRIASEPAADVYIDGKSSGHTPVTVPLTAGPHKLLLIAEEYALLRQEITAGGPLSLKLVKAKLPEDVAGEQVVKIKCKTKGELRILVDGHDTGLLCPTDELTLSSGRHTFGFLRPATEELQEKQQKVKSGRSATKLKVKF